MYQFSQTLQTALAAGNPQRVLLEFIKTMDGTAYNPHVEFSNEDILLANGVRLTEEFNPEMDLQIGLCPSAQIEFQMLNDQGQLLNFEFGVFKAYLGARIDTGTPAVTAKTKNFTEGGSTAIYEFAPLGTFVAHRPAIVKKKVIDVVANDQMILFDDEMPDAETLNLTYPTTLAGLCQAICSHVGVTLEVNSWMNSGMVLEEELDDFQASTMRDVLGWIAGAACSNAKFNRSGKLTFAWFNPTTKTYDEHDYSDFTPTWYQTQPIDGLLIQNSNSKSRWDNGGDNQYIMTDNPFLRQPDDQE